LMHAAHMYERSYVLNPNEHTYQRLNELATLLKNTGNDAKIPPIDRIKLYTCALNLHDKYVPNAWEEKTKIRTNLGRVCFRVRDFANSSKYFEQAHNMAKDYNVESILPKLPDLLMHAQTMAALSHLKADYPTEKWQEKRDLYQTLLSIPSLSEGEIKNYQGQLEEINKQEFLAMKMTVQSGRESTASQISSAAESPIRPNAPGNSKEET